MGLMDYFVIILIIAVVGLAAGYVIRAKKKGRKCIGCPHSGNCASCSSCGDFREPEQASEA